MKTAEAEYTERAAAQEANSEKEVIEELASLDSNTISHLRRRAQKQLYFMAKGVMRYKDVNPSTHGAFCRFFQDEGKDRRLGLMPRGHLKSSIATEADSVRLAVDNPDECRILIVNEVVDNAKGFLSTIKAQFEKNQFLRILFPELILDRFTGPGIQWSSEGATIPRSTSYKEPTWMPAGVGAAVTSKHFSRIKADDLIGLEASRSPAEMKRAINWTSNIESLAISAHETIVDFIGTRWKRNDLYGDIIDRYGTAMAVFTRSVVEEGKIIFPEKYDWEFLNRIMTKSPDVWAGQYMNDPTSEFGSDFNVRDLRYFHYANSGDIVAGSDTWSRSALDRIITVDPNSGSKTAPDEAVVTVLGVSPTDDVFVLEQAGSRYSPTELVDRTFDLCMKWRPRIVGFEKAGQQNTQFYFEEKMKEEGMYFRVQPLLHGNKDKTDRIRTALDSIVASQRLWVLRSQVELVSQIANFPDVKNDDRIDGVSYGPQLWRTPIGIDQQKKNRSAVKLMLSRRSKVTGYSNT